jgi:hypothetical protein
MPLDKPIAVGLPIALVAFGTLLDNEFISRQ